MKEIDALGGVMGVVTDLGGIQFRMLNKSKGPAVYGPRAQADREIYRMEMQKKLASQPNLHFLEDSVEDLIIENKSVRGNHNFVQENFNW